MSRNLPKISGDKLRNWRMKRHLTQEQLAKKADISESSVSSHECCASSDVFCSTLAAYAKALGCTENDLLYDMDNPPITLDEGVTLFTKDNQGQTDAFEEDEALTGIDEMQNGDDDQAKTDVLSLDPCADQILQVATAGLITSVGDEDRVSTAIAFFATYLRNNFERMPKLQDEVLYWIAVVHPILLKCRLDVDTVDMRWTSMKNSFSELSNALSLPPAAIEDAGRIKPLLFWSQPGGDDEKLRAIKFVACWIRNYWSFVSKESAAYEVLEAVSHSLTMAPTDFETRSKLVAVINWLVCHLSICANGKEMA